MHWESFSHCLVCWGNPACLWTPQVCCIFCDNSFFGASTKPFEPVNLQYTWNYPSSFKGKLVVEDKLSHFFSEAWPPFMISSLRSLNPQLENDGCINPKHLTTLDAGCMCMVWRKLVLMFGWTCLQAFMHLGSLITEGTESCGDLLSVSDWVHLELPTLQTFPLSQWKFAGVHSGECRELNCEQLPASPALSCLNRPWN